MLNVEYLNGQLRTLRAVYNQLVQVPLTLSLVIPLEFKFTIVRAQFSSYKISRADLDVGFKFSQVHLVGHCLFTGTALTPLFYPV